VSGSPPPILRAYRTVQSSASGLTVIPNPTVVGRSRSAWSSPRAFWNPTFSVALTSAATAKGAERRLHSPDGSHGRPQTPIP
jgi:hypothetical protein